MAALKSEEPLVGFRYEVHIIPESKAKNISLSNAASVASSAAGGADKAGFSEISGVTVTLETEEIKDGAGGEVTFLPTERKFSPLVLKRGLSSAQSKLVTWVATSILADNIVNELVTKTVIVKLLSDQGDPLVYWVFTGAYPTKWSVSGLKAMSNELVIEEIELKYKAFYPVFTGK